jgi:uncharacterized protein YjbI with pentapeptide repeats
MSVPTHVAELLGGYSVGERDFRGVELPGAILTRAKLAGAKLSKAALTKADLSWADLSETDLSGADLSKADLGWADLSKANLSGANLIRANLIRANLKGANLSGANLSGANLSEADLSRANLGGANLRGANLNRVDLSKADLSKADLSWADLSEANLEGANLIRADLIRADLIRADLSGANLSKANLSGASLTQTVLEWTVFGDLNLVRANGLASTIHLAPSFVDLASLKLAQGKLPDAFLQGCGLAEWEILASKVYDRKLTPEDLLDLQTSIHAARIKPQVSRRVFISHSGNDQDFVARMRARLLDEGVPCWTDSHEMKPGPVERHIDKAIGEYGMLLLVLSESSIGSGWVQHEVREARNLEKRLGADANVLCPVSLDDSWMDDQRWPKRIMEQVKEKVVLPFAEWRDAPWFEDQFRSLVDGLRLFHPPPESTKREPD